MHAVNASTVYELQEEAEGQARTYEILAENIAYEMRDNDNSTAWMDHPQVVAARDARDAAHNKMLNAQTEIGGVVFCVAQDNLEDLKKRLNALNRKADRIGAEPITMEVTGETVILSYNPSEGEVWDPYENEMVAIGTMAMSFEHVYVVIQGKPPKVEGYTIIAHIAHTEVGPLLSRLPITLMKREQYGLDSNDDQSVVDINLDRYRDADPTCDHCGKIRSRKDTYIVCDDESGEVKQVGRTCLRDFTGSNDPERIAKLLEYVREFFRHASQRGVKPVLNLEDVMTHIAMTIRQDGGYRKWDTRQFAFGNHWAWIRQSKDRDGQPEWTEPKDEDRTLAKKVIEYFRNLDPNQCDDFTLKLHRAVSLDHVVDRTEGMLGYAPVAYAKALDREITKKQDQEKSATKEFLGEIKERLTLTLTVTKIISTENRYGYGEDPTKPLYIFTDPKGNEVKWFASDWQGLEQGETYEITGTVKKHEEHERFGKSTVITRCRILETA